MKIMTVIGFLIALAVVGLTLFTTTLAKLREYGVVKALGAGPGRLATVLAQAVWSVALGLLFAVAVALVLGAAIGALLECHRRDPARIGAQHRDRRAGRRWPRRACPCAVCCGSTPLPPSGDRHDRRRPRHRRPPAVEDLR